MTGDDEAGMYWTLEDYVESVVLQHGLKLVGWPPDIPFQNLSNIRGGVSALTHLELRWESGILRFVRIWWSPTAARPWCTRCRSPRSGSSTRPRPAR